MWGEDCAGNGALVDVIEMELDGREREWEWVEGGGDRPPGDRVVMGGYDAFEVGMCRQIIGALRGKGRGRVRVDRRLPWR